MSDLEGMFRQPKNTLPKINSIYAFVSVDAEDGNEGVCAAPYAGTGLGMLPMIAADETRLKDLRPWATALVEHSGMKIKLVRFTTREEIEEFAP